MTFSLLDIRDEARKRNDIAAAGACTYYLALQELSSQIPSSSPTDPSAPGDSCGSGGSVVWGAA